MGKGSDNELEFRNRMKDAGFAPYRPATVRYGENDVWGLFDVLAIAPHGRLWAVQVKSNRAEGIREFSRCVWLFREAGLVTAYAVKYNNEGWRLIEVTGPGEWENVVDERDADVNMGEGIAGYLSDIPRESRVEKVRNGGRG